MTDTKKGGKWKAGQSGNPRGRTPGKGEPARLRESIAAHVPAIIASLVESAKAGDAQAARLLLERVLPALKPVEAAAKIAMPTAGSLTEQGQVVIAAVAGGALAPGQGAALLAGLGTLARIVEVDELMRRIEALEKNHGDT